MCRLDAYTYTHGESDTDGSPNTVANYAYTDSYRDAEPYPHTKANTAAAAYSGTAPVGRRHTPMLTG